MAIRRRGANAGWREQRREASVVRGYATHLATRAIGCTDVGSARQAENQTDPPPDRDNRRQPPGKTGSARDPVPACALYFTFSMCVTVSWPLTLSAENFTRSPAFTVFNSAGSAA